MLLILITCTMTYYGIASAAYKISNRASIQNIDIPWE